MPGYVRIMNEEVQIWLDSLGDYGEIDIAKALVSPIQKVAAHAIMGKDFRDQMGDEFWALYTDLGKAIDPVLPPNLPLPKFHRRDRAKVRMREILTPIITHRRTTQDTHEDMLQEFATATYKDGRPVEDEVIVGIIMGLMFAGHETTVGQAAWTVVELARHPSYLLRVLGELERVLPFGKPVDIATVAELNHVLWAVHETTRMHPSADMILRYVEEEVEIGDYRIPAGWLVLLSSTLGHNMPDIFANPDAFDPLRFAPGREEDKHHRYAITGFGGGIHKCTGMNFANNEMITIAALLFQQFDLEMLTPNVQTNFNDGAARPKDAIIRYRRKPRPAITPELIHQAAAVGCPHMATLVTES
jgi:sterol 14-demethylase